MSIGKPKPKISLPALTVLLVLALLFPFCGSLSLRPTKLFDPYQTLNSQLFEESTIRSHLSVSTQLQAATSADKDNGEKNNVMNEQSQQQQQPLPGGVESPLFSVGMIADIQYAPIPDGFSYTGTPRYYRHSLTATKHAFETFCGNGGTRGVDLVVNLGDIIDGKCLDIAGNGGEGFPTEEPHHPGILSLSEVEAAMEPYSGTTTEQKVKILHSYGNHCLYNLNRTELREKLGIPFRSEAAHSDTNVSVNVHGNSTIARSDEDDTGDNDGDLVGYYSYVHPPLQPQQSSIKFLVLDGYDICLMRRCPKHSAKRKAALEILQRENGVNLGAGNENSPEGLEGLQKRFVAFNGAVGPAQLEWLRDELEATRKANHNGGGDQKVIVLSHQPIHPGSSNPVCLIWNYDAVLQTLREYSDVVVASFAGHAHKGGYVHDEDSGIHFRVVEAVLESKPPTTTFGILNVYGDRLELEGHGDCASAVYKYKTI